MLASVIFSIRPQSDLKAWHAPGGAQGGALNGATYTAGSGGGILGTGYLDMASASKIQGLYWPAPGNFPTDNVFSVLWRGAIIGSNSTQNALWALNFPAQSGTVGSLFQSNTLYTDIESLISTSDIYSDGGAWTPTLGTLYDLVWLFNIASNGTNNVQVYVDGTLLYEGDTTGNWGAGPRNNIGYSVGFGTGPYTVVAQTKVNEFVIWDGLIDPTSVTLTSGNGSLNGASRSAFVDSVQLDGSLYSDPGVENVLSGVSYNYSGISKTGTVTLPTTSQVKHGTSFGAAGVQTGTYNGSDQWSDPGSSHVLQGVTYLANGSTLTGSLVAAATQTMRDFENSVLASVGATSLTDLEYTSIVQTGIQLGVYNNALYTQLNTLLLSRESVSTVTDRLRYFFLSKNVVIDTVSTAKSNILMGFSL